MLLLRMRIFLFFCICLPLNRFMSSATLSFDIFVLINLCFKHFGRLGVKLPCLHVAYQNILSLSKCPMEVSNNLIQRYRGCLTGALVGDCLGSYFETGDDVDKAILKKHIDLTEISQGENIKLTDDTQMTQELADSLISQNCFDAKDLAERFTNRYYFDGENAGYGSSVEIFAKLKSSNFQNPLLPAQEQFDGQGSLRNGAAMRVAPVPLFAFPHLTQTAQLAEKNALVTHAHLLGRHGAVFQALAIRRCLLNDASDKQDFLIKYESDLREFGICIEYLDALNSIKKLLGDESVTDNEVVDLLGTDVTALKSVPTAIFCFLKFFSPVPQSTIDTRFRKTIEFAISLGGDTDTIASMAGALAGSQYGLPTINNNTVLSCPDRNRALSQADKLFALAKENFENVKI